MINKCILFLSLFFCTICFAQKTLPNIALTDIDGKSTNILNEISEDKITVLDFWATWCVPCINELDAISEVYEDWQEALDLEIIAIATDDARTQKRIKPLVNGKGWEYKILIDKNQELKRTLNISVIPHVIILKGSEILYRNTGYTPGAEEELFDIIKKYSK